jgi:GNAT superfamily N-acetyltransferase
MNESSKNQSSTSKWSFKVVDEISFEEAEQLGKFSASFTDEEDVNSHRFRNEEYYLWKLKKSPYGRGFVSLAMDGHKIVGSTTITMKKAIVNGKIAKVAEIGDTFTDPKYQRQGIFASLVKATVDRAVSSGVDLIYGTPNMNSLPGYLKKLNFLELSKCDQKLVITPIRPVGLFAKNDTWVTRILKVLDLIYAHGYLGVTSSILQTGSSHKPLFFGDEFDDLEAESGSEFGLRFARSSADLRYRFIDNPESHRYGLITNRDKSGKLNGFLVFKKSVKKGLNVLWIAELSASNASVKRSLISALIQHAIASKCVMVAEWEENSFVRALKRLPYITVVMNSVPVIVFNNDDGSALELSNRVLKFSLMDSDNI